MTTFPYQFLSPSSTLVNQDGIPSDNGRQFLFTLFNRTGGNSGIIPVVKTGVSAGSTEPTQLSGDFNEVLTTPPGSSVMLDDLQPGQIQWVFNGGANSLKIYPAAGGKIDALPINSAYSLASGRTQMFVCYSAGQIRTIVWG